jgi:hypothetical protein
MTPGGSVERMATPSLLIIYLSQAIFDIYNEGEVYSDYEIPGNENCIHPNNPYPFVVNRKFDFSACCFLLKF